VSAWSTFGIAPSDHEIFDRLASQLQHTVRISKQTRRKIDGIELIRLKRDQGQQNLCFSSRPFVLCGLPVRRLPANQLLYERRNGQFVLQITGHPHYGVPFGQDRIVPIFLATMALRQKSQTVRLRTAAEMLETFGMAKAEKSIDDWLPPLKGSSARRCSLARKICPRQLKWFNDAGSTFYAKRISGTTAGTRMQSQMSSEM